MLVIGRVYIGGERPRGEGNVTCREVDCWDSWEVFFESVQADG